MEATQCDAPQRSTLATCIGVQADACGHGKLGGLLSGKLGDNRFLVRIVPRSVGRHLIPPSSSLATMSPTSSPAPPTPGAPPSSPLAPNSAALELARHDHDSVVGVLLTLPLFVRARAPGLVRKQRTQRLLRAYGPFWHLVTCQAARRLRPAMHIQHHWSLRTRPGILTQENAVHTKYIT